MKILNADNFENEVLESDMPVIVDFYADWCMPCKVMAPVVNEIEKNILIQLRWAKLILMKILWSHLTIVFYQYQHFYLLKTVKC